MEICLGSTSWPLLRASNTKWLSLVALSGKRCSEVSHVLGGGPRQRGPCKTLLEIWQWDRILDESVPSQWHMLPPPLCSEPSAPWDEFVSLGRHSSIFSFLTSLLSLNTGAALGASHAFSAKSYHTFISLGLHPPFCFAVCLCT